MGCFHFPCFNSKMTTELKNPANGSVDRRHQPMVPPEVHRLTSGLILPPLPSPLASLAAFYCLLFRLICQFLWVIAELWLGLFLFYFTQLSVCERRNKRESDWIWLIWFRSQILFLIHVRIWQEPIALRTEVMEEWEDQNECQMLRYLVLRFPHRYLLSENLQQQRRISDRNVS